jgi:hypothetical protein
MRSLFHLLPAVLLLVACGPAQPPAPIVPQPATTKGCGPTLVHDQDWYTSGRTQPFLPGLDMLHYPISIASELPPDRRDSLQRYFDQGLLLAYGFNHAEAARSFWQATRLDSTNAMAWWGFAYVLGPNYNAGMEPDNYQRAHAAITRAHALKAGCTPKEQGLIEAMTQRYTPQPVEDRSALDQAYSTALRAVATTYPDDADVATLFAESLMDQHPWDLWAKDGTEKPWTPEIIVLLERGMKNFPRHPGAHHLYIHAVEASRTPERALPSAAFLADAVPGSGHLVHMPSHIHIRTGRYHEGVLANRRSVSVDSGYTAQCHAQGIYPLAYFPHNIHFLSACATFSGEQTVAWTSALDLRAQLAKDLLHLPDFRTFQHYHAFPWMVAVKLELWDKLAAEPRPGDSLRYAMGLWHYAQGMRRVRTGDVDGARAELDSLEDVQADTTLADMLIWGINPGLEVLHIAHKVLEGEVSAARGDMPAAMALLKEAVIAEDAMQYQEPPDWSFPSRHELGALQLKAGLGKEAEQTFRDDLVMWPENGYALQGLHDALMVQGRAADAEALKPRIATAWQYADGRSAMAQRTMH